MQRTPWRLAQILLSCRMNILALRVSTVLKTFAPSLSVVNRGAAIKCGLNPLSVSLLSMRKLGHYQRGRSGLVLGSATGRFTARSLFVGGGLDRGRELPAFGNW